MINIELLSGKLHQIVHLDETDMTYGDVMKHINKKIKYEEFDPENFKLYTIYARNSNILMHKGNCLNLQDEIDFNITNLQLILNIKYLCCVSECKTRNDEEVNRIEYFEKEIHYFDEALDIETQYKNLILQYINKPFILKYIEQTDELCKLALSKCCDGIRYIKNLTEELCIIAINSNCCAFAHIPGDMKTVEICKLAISNGGMMLKYVPDGVKTPELCILAVSQNGMSLQYVPIDIRDENICKIAFRQNSKSFIFVPNKIKECILSQ
jgi:hypothetical protein